MSIFQKSLYNSPYYVLLDSTRIPQADDENAITKLGGDCIHYYCIYFAKSSFTSEIYMNYEQYLEKWIIQHYKDTSVVNYTVAFLCYQRNTITLTCTKI